MLLKKILPLFLILNSNISLAQPELRFNPFDWVLYKHTGSINSISFGDRYAFIGTQNGGVVRFNTRLQRFEEPITRSQGLKSDFVTAVHYASSGILWVATINALNYSFDAEGDWRSVSLESLGLSTRNPIIRIGDDGKDIWVEASGQLMRIDGVTGIKLESMIRQNKKIFWSSGPNTFWQDPAEFLFKYTFLDGWMQNLNEMIDPNGQTISITTIAENNFGEIMIGCEDGSLFFGDRTMKLLSSFKFGINSLDVNTIAGNQTFWIGGRNSLLNGGLTVLDISRNIYDHYSFSNMINVDATPIFSSLKIKKDIFFGGENKFIHFNTKNSFWSEYYLPTAINNNIVKDIIENDHSLWLGTNNGLIIFDVTTNEFVENRITDHFKNYFIFDMLKSNKFIFIGTDVDLYIYDIKNESLYEHDSFGYEDEEFQFSAFRTNFTAMTTYRNEIYFANRESVIKLNISSRKWSKVFGSEVFSGDRINAMAADRRYLFMATDNDLIQFDIKDRIIEVFNYKFLGNINTLKIDRTRLLIGTSEGIVSYSYK